MIAPLEQKTRRILRHADQVTCRSSKEARLSTPENSEASEMHNEDILEERRGMLVCAIVRSRCRSYGGDPTRQHPPTNYHAVFQIHRDWTRLCVDRTLSEHRTSVQNPKQNDEWWRARLCAISAMPVDVTRFTDTSKFSCSMPTAKKVRVHTRLTEACMLRISADRVAGCFPSRCSQPSLHPQTSTTTTPDCRTRATHASQLRNRPSLRRPL